MSTTQPAPEALEPDRSSLTLDDKAPLALLWSNRVYSLATLAPNEFKGGDGEKERHRIYSLALMKLVKEYWNGNKKGSFGEYPGRKDQLWSEASRNGNFVYRINKADDPFGIGIRVRDYLGHNIAALAVDGDGDIIDFEFNHNEVFCSSVEHAESRLVRRIFSLALLDQGWNLATFASTSKPATNLSNVTIYTSLESCAQCAGIMMLAGVKKIVYLHRDFGTSAIGNILYNLTSVTQIPAPRPIPGSDFGFEYFDRLTEGFRKFNEGVATSPFWKHPSGDRTKDDKSASVTSYLCTDQAYKIFEDATHEFDKLKPAALKHPRYSTDQDTAAAADKASTSENSTKQFRAKSNAEVLDQAASFVKEAVRIGRRGTPHQL